MRQLVYMFFPVPNTSRFRTTIVGTGTRCAGVVWFKVSPTYCRTLPSHGCYHSSSTRGFPCGPATTMAESSTATSSGVSQQFARMYMSTELVVTEIVADIHRDTCEKEKGELAVRILNSRAVSIRDCAADMVPSSGSATSLRASA
ncbi:hypothetical protein PISMIDRAFT_453008 [Pisolithus microcarpus 441]|uniref:Uncharacterized protein n=1 Tax=Pisolithus microcarpus 441 TaxID=765257 RepID=A0A0C9XJ84_9AGAM|nr:hypothetical protein BKA83DRAFT_453008 [Pisolithus microcarpus]KIK12375.1 hypothetical protein PISMIDRAFT_453008 [Pisolithus microcarpus 441]